MDPIDVKKSAEEKRDKEIAALNELRLSNVIKEYVAKQLKPNNRTWKEAQRTLIVEVLSVIADKSINDIGRRDIAKILDAHRNKPATAHKAYRNLSAMINWSVRRGLIETSPITGTKAPRPPKARDRVLTDKEVRLLWRSLPMAGPNFEQLFKVLLLTAQRRGEVAEMTWSELDFENDVWTIPSSRSKNKQSKTTRR